MSGRADRAERVGQGRGRLAPGDHGVGRRAADCAWPSTLRSGLGFSATSGSAGGLTRFGSDGRVDEWRILAVSGGELPAPYEAVASRILERAPRVEATLVRIDAAGSQRPELVSTSVMMIEPSPVMMRTPPSSVTPGARSRRRCTWADSLRDGFARW